MYHVREHGDLLDEELGPRGVAVRVPVRQWRCPPLQTALQIDRRERHRVSRLMPQVIQCLCRTVDCVIVHSRRESRQLVNVVAEPRRPLGQIDPPRLDELICSALSIELLQFYYGIAKAVHRASRLLLSPREANEKSAISPSLMVCLFQPRLACNLSGQELSPTHASLRSATADHDYYFELLFLEEERDAQSITRCSAAHHGDFRAVPRANRT